MDKTLSYFMEKLRKGKKAVEKWRKNQYDRNVFVNILRHSYFYLFVLYSLVRENNHNVSV
jgi:hypothetical protein